MLETTAINVQLGFINFRNYKILKVVWQDEGDLWVGIDVEGSGRGLI
jgi:hypothetical protein